MSFSSKTGGLCESCRSNSDMKHLCVMEVLDRSTQVETTEQTQCRHTTHRMSVAAGPLKMASKEGFLVLSHLDSHTSMLFFYYST